VIDLGTRVPVTIPGESTGPEASRFDPHWWHDPRNAQAAVAAIRGALTRSNPDARTSRCSS
jgi:zinc/manganese transport system substrate-binding protein